MSAHPADSKKPRRKVFYYATYGVGVLALCAISYFLGKQSDVDKPPSIGFLREPTSNSLISPLLAVSVGDKSDFPELNSLESKISTAIQQAVQNGQASSAAVYFQNFSNGHWTGVNENDGFDPASLLKVPIMMATFRQADNNPSFLSQSVTYEPPPIDLAQDGFDSLVPGNVYTVNQLVSSMIDNSDNGAKDALGAYINTNTLQQTFTYLNLPPLSATSSYTISPKQYARFFRILYNATYLSQNMSEKALSLLSMTTFNQGIVAGVPADTIIAHKFGQYVDPENSSTVELHDCGIVYDPSRPYLICAMTKGSNLSSLANVIATISHIVYLEVQNDYK